MNIIVVTDSPNIEKNIKTVLRRIDILNNDNDLNVLYFSKFCLELKKVINKTAERKIYILNVPNKDNEGIKIARYIRDVDWDSDLIFLVSNADMFEVIHRNVHNVYSVIENNDINKLQTDIKDIYLKKFDHRMFMCKGREYSIQVFYHAILYIYRDKEERKLVVKTIEQDYTVNLSLTEALKRLDNRFHLVHRGCIANLDQIRMFNWSKGYFVLKDNTKVFMLSKKFKKEVSKIYDQNNNS